MPCLWHVAVGTISAQICRGSRGSVGREKYAHLRREYRKVKWKKRHVGDIAAYGSGIRVHHSPVARDLWSWLSYRI